jgi:soluble lytic murein transglycosylase
MERPRGFAPGTRSGTRVDRRRGPSRGRGRLWLALGVLCVAVVVLALVGLWARDALPSRLGALLYPLHYQGQIGAASKLQGIDPFLVAAVVKAESNFNAGARSSVGATGLMQLMPATAAWIAARPDWKGSDAPDLTRSQDSIDLGTYYLSYLLERFGGNTVEALAAYNAGEGTVTRWLAQRRKDDPSSGALTVEEIPFPETRAFVERVLRYRDLYRKYDPNVFAGGQVEEG